MENQQNKPKPFFEKLQLQYVTPIVAIITAIYSFGFTVRRDQLDATGKVLNNKKTETETNIRQQEFDNQLKMAVYQEVKNALLADKGTKINEVTLTIVKSMLKEDTPAAKDFKEKLTTLLLANDGGLTATENKIDVFEKTASIPLPPTKFTVDVFYLEDIISESKSRAEKVAASISAIHPGYYVRVRLLPKYTNALPQYRVQENQIRFEANEEEVAKDLLEIIKKENIFLLEEPSLLKTKFQSKDYIGIFVRNM